MPLRRAKPLTWHFVGCSDAVNGSNAFPGAMRALSNLCPAPSDAKAWVPRPARDFLTNFVAAAFSTSPSTIQGISIFGDTAFGLITTLRNPGRDEPFAVDLITGQIVPVSGVTRDNCPTTPLPLGQTQLPIAAVVGAYDVWTHPGFSGGIFNPVGLTTVITANAVNGASQMTGFFLTGDFAGRIFPGMSVTDSLGAIPANTYVLGTSSIDFNVIASGVAGNNFFTVTSAANIAIGQALAGPGPFAGFVSAIAGTTITYTGMAIPANFTSQIVAFHGTLLLISQGATANATNDVVTLATLGNGSVKFGWFDLTGLNTTLIGTLTSGQPAVSATVIAGLSPGQNVSGTGIPAGARILTLENPTFEEVQGNIDGGSNLWITVNYPAGTPVPLAAPAVGTPVVGPGIALNATVSGSNWTYISATQSSLHIQLSVSGTGAAASGLYNIAGLYTIVLDMNATTSGSETLTITGGTITAPLWCAGDTAINNLPSTPIGVGSFNGRAWFACGEDGAPFSDIQNPISRTYASQAVIPGNGLPVTACMGQPLLSPVTGGMTQALYLFQGTGAVQQVSGDMQTNNLAVQALNIATGTLAPGSIAPTTLGMAFMSPEGMRLIDFSGTIGQPIGEGGQGIVVPFINAYDPTRVVAAANGATLRIALVVGQGQLAVVAPSVEWWYDLKRKVWSGPHTLQTSRIAPYGETFITAASDVPAQLYKSASVPSGLTDYNEDGNELTWAATTTFLPDTEAMFQNGVNQGTIGLANPGDQPVVWTVSDETQTVLDSGVIVGPYTEPVFGGPPPWGVGYWYGVQEFQTAYRHQRLAFHRELVFRQAQFAFGGASRLGAMIDSLQIRYQITGYMLQDFPSVSLDISVPPLPTAPVINGSPQALVVSSTAAQFTAIGALLAQQAHYAVAELPAWALLFQQPGLSLALLPFLDTSGVTGAVHGNTTLDGLSTNVLTNGWLPGHTIEDSGGAIPPGTFIQAIATNGLSLTLSQPAVASIAGDILSVQGTTLATEWASPILPGTYVAQVRAVLPGYLTSFYAFLLTVTP